MNLAARGPIGGLIVGDEGVRLWGMTSIERLRRIFKRIGVEAHVPQAADVLIVHSGWVFDEALLKALAARSGVALADADGRIVAACVPGGGAAAAQAVLAGRAPQGCIALPAEEIGSAYNSALRKKEPPVLERLTADRVGVVEARLFQGSYKGVTDLVTKYVWPRPARIVTRWCALAKITPNEVTFAGFLLTIAAFVLFWRGQFGLGLLAAWLMTFLDTVDGKLARVTLTSSKIGNAFDHGIDLIHPPFWWWAWLVGVQAGAHPLAMPNLILAVVAGGYVAQRLEEGAFLAAFKLEMHAWRRFDSLFRLVTARRNPNLILLTLGALAGRPDLGLVAVAVWTAICFLVHLTQLIQAYAAPRGSVVSWLAR